MNDSRLYRTKRSIRLVTVNGVDGLFLLDLIFLSALHELDPEFRKATLGNKRLKSIARDLKFHVDPRYASVLRWSSLADKDCSVLQSMVICKQPGIGGAGTSSCVSVERDSFDSTFSPGTLRFVSFG